DAEVKRIVEYCYDRAKGVIKDQFETVKEIAMALLTKETLQGEELKSYLSKIQVEKAPKDITAVQPTS
ncbi:MAG: ATP-dependent zinc metalloprotease FtsH, partial [Caldisericaceae bacterium]